MHDGSFLASSPLLFRTRNSVVCRFLSAKDDHMNDDDDLCDDRLVYFIEFDWS